MKRVAVIGGTNHIPQNAKLVPIDFEYDILIISYLNCNLLVNTALGFETEITNALFRRKPVYVLNSGLSYLKAKNKQLLQLYISYQRKLSSFGVQFVDEVNIPNKQNTNKKLITKSDIENYNNTTIKISKNTLLTPLALDLAKQKNITIIRENEI